MAGIAVASLLLVYVAHPDWPTLGEYAPLIVVVCLGVRGRATLRRWLAPVYLLGLVAVSWLGLPAGVQPLPYAIVWCVFMAIAWGAGSVWHALIVARDETARAAALEERHGLARQLHDSVAEALAAVSLRAEQAKLSRFVAPEELDAIANDAARAVRELGIVVNVLRRSSDEQSEDAVPLTVHLERAEARLRESGFHPHVTTEGAAPVLRGRASHQLGRVIQEATTNMIRHGDKDEECAIVVDASPDALEVAFLNHRRRAGRQNVHRGSGFGQVSMRERVAVLGGTMASGPQGNAWLTSIRVPVGAGVGVGTHD